ncbi:MAG: hypothetical protein ACXVA9_10265 [Bdellovibrionales bacterium]
MGRNPKVELVDPTEKLNEVKFQLCCRIRRVWSRNGWGPEQLAIRMGTSRARVHQIDGLRVTELTVQQLFRYLARIEPDFEILIAI